MDARLWTLREIAAESMNGGLSADGIFLGEATPARIAGKTPGKASPANMDAVLKTAYLERLPELLDIVGDYGRRGLYGFDPEDGGGQWLPGGMTQAEIDALRTGLGVKSPAPKNWLDTAWMTFGQCLRVAALETAAMELSPRTMQWLFKHQGCSLDWTLFSAGDPLRGGPDMKPVRWDPAGDGSDVSKMPTDFQQIRELRNQTNWQAQEWTWLLPSAGRSGQLCITPSLPLACRLVADWNMQPPHPDLPTPSSMSERLWRWIAYEFREEVAGTGGEPMEEWRLAVLRQCVKSRSRVSILFGLTKRQGERYGLDLQSPSSPPVRAAWFIEASYRMHGRRGFMHVLDILNAEAKLRGFPSLATVFETGSWRINPAERARRDAAEASGKPVDRRGRPPKAAKKTAEEAEREVGLQTAQEAAEDGSRKRHAPAPRKRQAPAKRPPRIRAARTKQEAGGE